jgi:hypothetical protein
MSSTSVLLTLRGGLVLMIRRACCASCRCPDTLTRAPESKSRGESGDQDEALGSKRPGRTIKVEAEIDATDQLETAIPARPNRLAPAVGALEIIVYPPAAISTRIAASASGSLRCAGEGTRGAVPRRETHRARAHHRNEHPEEAFDRPQSDSRQVSLGMRVLSVDDLGFDAKGAACSEDLQAKNARAAKQRWHVRGTRHQRIP